MPARPTYVRAAAYALALVGALLHETLALPRPTWTAGGVITGALVLCPWLLLVACIHFAKLRPLSLALSISASVVLLLIGGALYWQAQSGDAQAGLVLVMTPLFAIPSLFALLICIWFMGVRTRAQSDERDT